VMSGPATAVSTWVTISWRTTDQLAPMQACAYTAALDCSRLMRMQQGGAACSRSKQQGEQVWAL
jgi:hypothetical protein